MSIRRNFHMNEEEFLELVKQIKNGANKSFCVNKRLCGKGYIIDVYHYDILNREFVEDPTKYKAIPMNYYRNLTKKAEKYFHKLEVWGFVGTNIEMLKLGLENRFNFYESVDEKCDQRKKYFRIK